MIAFAVYVIAFREPDRQSPALDAIAAAEATRLAPRRATPTVSPQRPPLQSAADASWIGTRVVQVVPHLKLRTGSALVSPEHRLFYRVEQVNGPSVELSAEENGLKGWVSADQVIPVQKGMDFFTALLRANPENPFAHAMRAVLCRDRKDFGAALDDLDAAIRLDSNDAWTFASRGLIWADKRQFNRAIADLDEAVRINPRFASAYCNRGLAWSGAGEYAKALADYDQAIQIDPQNAFAYFNRARLYTACPDVRYRNANTAVESARSACELTDWKIPSYIDALALACALAGRYEVASQYESEAIALVTNEQEKRDYRWRQMGYEQAQRNSGGSKAGSPAHHQEALFLFLSGHNEAVHEMALPSDPRTVIAKRDACYSELLGHFAARRTGMNDRAKMLLERAASRCQPSDWPYPVLRYLRGQIDEKALMAAAASGANGNAALAGTEDSRATEAHCYVALDLLQKGRQDLALSHLLWIKVHRNTEVFAYPIALAELERIEGK
jgi:tetratricopeptide (TPR) repeat protein